MLRSRNHASFWISGRHAIHAQYPVTAHQFGNQDARRGQGFDTVSFGSVLISWSRFKDEDVGLKTGKCRYTNASALIALKLGRIFGVSSDPVRFTV